MERIRVASLQYFVRPVQAFEQFRDQVEALVDTAEIMVRPSMQGHGIGKKLYAARREIVQRLGLLRIRAGARLRGYCTYAKDLSPEQYLERVIEGKIYDPTLSFQIRQGFHVMAAVRNNLRNDPESLGWAAVIEWLNEEVATEADRQHHGIGKK
ncbi:MAG: hypothetical protein FJW20_24350 [Acidimicrobiia bacterium]|nr:hypothetical protein [Acidimicrobiia bacterium]